MVTLILSLVMIINILLFQQYFILKERHWLYLGLAHDILLHSYFRFYRLSLSGTWTNHQKKNFYGLSAEERNT